MLLTLLYQFVIMHPACVLVGPIFFVSDSLSSFRNRLDHSLTLHLEPLARKHMHIPYHLFIKNKKYRPNITQVFIIYFELRLSIKTQVYLLLLLFI